MLVCTNTGGQKHAIHNLQIVRAGKKKSLGAWEPEDMGQPEG